MKKRVFIIFSLSLASLIGCSGFYKVPTTNYEKVKTAFNGVEKSFKKIASGKNKLALPKYKNVDSGLSTIFDLFTSNDIRGHSIEDISYNEPPMIQFQYLKAVFDKVGQGFEFGTKYYDNIVGDMYVDFNTGFKDETKNEANKYAFDYELAIDININENDLINADVSFNINLTQNDKSYNSKWYVNLLLDYDMENASPTYNLTLLTENDESDLPYFDRFTYEYDYVDVTNSKINEWRKLCMHASERLVKDDNHPSFSSYLNENFTYKVDYPKWFKNNDYYKLQNMSESQGIAVANAMFDEIGLNANDINGDPFFDKQGTQNKVMQDIYKNFCKIYGDEIVYDIICRNRDDDNGNNGNNQGEETNHVFIRAMQHDGQTGADKMSVGNDRIGDIFNGYVDPFGDKSIIDLWYTDENYNLLEKVPDYTRLSYQFTTGVNEDDDADMYFPVEVTLDTRILEAYAMLKDFNGFEYYNRNIALLVKDSQDVYGVVTLSYMGEFEKA